MRGALHAIEHQEHRGEIEHHQGQQDEEDAPAAALRQFRAALQDLVFEVGLHRHNHVDEDQADHGDDARNHQEGSPQGDGDLDLHLVGQGLQPLAPSPAQGFTERGVSPGAEMVDESVDYRRDDQGAEKKVADFQG